MTSDNGENDPGSVRQNLLLNQLYKRIQDAERLEDILYELEQKLLELLDAERLTIYRKESQEVVSWYHTGSDVNESIRVPIGPSSIAGYVAMSGEAVRINDVYDTDELAAIHPSLGFDYTYDQNTGYMTESMVVVPISYKEKLLGVMQVINRRQGGAFTDQDVIHAIAIAQLIGEKFRSDLKAGTGPYELLIRSGIITLDRFEELEAQAVQMGVPVTILLRRQEKISREDIGQSFENYFQVPFLPYDEAYQPDSSLLEQLNPSYLASNNWVPFRGNQDQIIVLMDDPNNADRVMEIQQLLNDPRPELRVGLKEDILRYLGYAYPEDEDPEEVDLDDIVGRLDNKSLIDDGDGDGDDLYDENASAIIQLVNHIIIRAVNIDASDIHVEPAKGKDDAIVRMRVDGECSEQLRIPYTHIRAVISRIKVLSRLDITERRKPQSGKMAVRMEGKPLELRVECVPTVNGESAVLRVLASGAGAMPLEKLNILEHNMAKLLDVVSHPHGICLVVGPTGSGKTTTLHGLLGHINTVERKILTAEDPVEISQPGLQQLQVLPKIGLTFAAALRSFLRADPDVILIGEMRDFETASTGIEASLTGHLVFSTLHTNSAPETVVRLLDMGLDPMNFSDALLCVLAQRLVRTLCKSCKQQYEAPPDEIEKLVHLYGEESFAELGHDPSKLTLWRPIGCEDCMDTGYKGRTGIHELLIASKQMKKLVSQSSPADEIRKLAYEQGMRSLFQDGISKILQGDTDLMQLRKVASS